MRTLAALTIGAGGLSLLFLGDDARAVMTPAVIIVSMTMIYVVVLYRRDRQLPVFEPATFFVLAGAGYSAIPLFQFYYADLRWSPLADNRFYDRYPSPQEFGGFAWHHVAVLASFIITYLIVRGRKREPLRRVAPPPAATGAAAALWIVVITLYAVLVGNIFSTVSAADTPLAFRQFMNVLLISWISLKQALIVFLFTRWREQWARVFLVLLLAVEIVLLVARGFSARSLVFVLVLSAVLAYHRVVRPLRLTLAVTAGLLLIGGFVAAGMYRDISYVDEKYVLRGAANEFQSIFANAYDLHKRIEEGELPPIPPQMFWADFYRLIPSPILPFEKIEPGRWYLGVLGLEGTRRGVLFGIVAEGIIGGGMRELIVRGILLAALYALMQRLYHRHSSSYWWTVTHLFIAIWAYYAFRSTTFDVFYKLVYYLLPAVVMVKVLELVLTIPRRVRQRYAPRQLAPQRIKS